MSIAELWGHDVYEFRFRAEVDGVVAEFVIEARTLGDAIEIAGAKTGKDLWECVLERMSKVEKVDLSPRWLPCPWYVGSPIVAPTVAPFPERAVIWCGQQPGS